MKIMTRDDLVSELAKGTAEFVDVSFHHEDLRGVTIKGATFRHCDFTDAKLNGTTIRDTLFLGCVLRGVTMWEANLTGVTFNDVDFTNLNVEDSLFKGVTFHRCAFTLALFYHTKLLLRRVTSCTFMGTDILKCTLSMSEMLRTTFTGIVGLKVYSVGPVGTFDGNVTYFPTLHKVFAGCWQGDEEEFFAKCERVQETRPLIDLNLELATNMVKTIMEKEETL